MPSDAKAIPAPIIPVLRYRDCTKAVDFLTKVFGFTEGSIYRDDDGKVVHAGGLPRAEDVAAWLKPACGCSA